MLSLKRILLAALGLPLVVGGGLLVVILTVYLAFEGRQDPDAIPVTLASLASLVAAAVGAGVLRRVWQSLGEPPERALARLRWPFRIVLSLCMLGLAAWLVSWQHGIYDEDMEDVAEARDEIERQVEKVRAASRDWERFQEDAANYQAELDRLYLILPISCDVERFRQSLATWCDRHGLMAGDLHIQVFEQDFLRRCVFRFDLHGDVDTLLHLTDDPRELRRAASTRIAEVRSAEVADGVLATELHLFAHSGVPADRWAGCDAERWPEVESRLWPYSRWAGRAREDLGVSCTQLEGRERESDAMARFESNRRMLGLSLDIIRSLMETHDYPGADQLPVLEDDPHPS